MASNAKRTPILLGILIFMQVFLGLNGVVGGAALLIAPDGRLLGMPLRQLRNSPFADFTIPGLLLLLFLGVYPLAVAFSLWKRPSWRWPNNLNPFQPMHWAWAASLVAGIIAMVWIAVQIQWIQPWPLHAFIFGWGALIVVVTLLPGVRNYFVRASA